VLSVFDTLKETFVLWLRNFRYLVVLNLICAPEFIYQFNDNFHTSPAIDFMAQTGFLWLDFVSLAAFLGLLNKSPSEFVWMAAWRSVKAYTWTFIWALILILLVFIPTAIVIGSGRAIVDVFVLAKISDLQMLRFLHYSLWYFAVMTSALAFPCIVMEKVKAKDALELSWGMTRRHFLYVWGCYLILFVGEWFLRWMTDMPMNHAGREITWAQVPLEVVLEVASYAWIILIWAMCQRIKAAEAQSLPAALPN
jgi:hypothetical protein